VSSIPHVIFPSVPDPSRSRGGTGAPSSGSRGRSPSHPANARRHAGPGGCSSAGMLAQLDARLTPDPVRGGRHAGATPLLPSRALQSLLSRAPPPLLPPAAAMDDGKGGATRLRCGGAATIGASQGPWLEDVGSGCQGTGCTIPGRCCRRWCHRAPSLLRRRRHWHHRAPSAEDLHPCFQTPPARLIVSSADRPSRRGGKGGGGRRGRGGREGAGRRAAGRTPTAARSRGGAGGSAGLLDPSVPSSSPPPSSSSCRALLLHGGTCEIPGVDDVEVGKKQRERGTGKGEVEEKTGGE
jgi:hypothetical protein